MEPVRELSSSRRHVRERFCRRGKLRSGACAAHVLASGAGESGEGSCTVAVERHAVLRVSREPIEPVKIASLCERIR